MVTWVSFTSLPLVGVAIAIAGVIASAIADAITTDTGFLHAIAFISFFMNCSFPNRTADVRFPYVHQHSPGETIFRKTT